MAKDVRRKRVFVRPPRNVKKMSDEELERWAEEAILAPLLGPEPKRVREAKGE